MNKEYVLHKIVIIDVDTNCYFLVNENSDSILIDAGGNGSEIFEFINEKNINLKCVFLTHGHYDHIDALNNIVLKYNNLKVYVNEKERRVIENTSFNLSKNGLNDETLSKIIYLKDGETIDEIGLKIKNILTPGHTEGSSCYYIEDMKILFSGDTVFRGSYGRYDLPTGNRKEIINSFINKIFVLPNDTAIYPGHGDFTYIEYEKKYNYLLELIN